MGNDRCVPSACQRGEAERLLPVAPALSEGPERAQGPRQPRLGLDPHVCTGRARLPVRRLHAPPQQRGRPAEVADGRVCLPQAIGCLHLQGALAERSREFEGLPACRMAPSGSPVTCVQRPSRPAPVPAGPDRRAPGPGPRPRPTGRGAAHSLPVRPARLPTRGGARWPAPRCRRDSGRCARAWRACSKAATASRNAARSLALAPACWQ